MNQNDNIVQIDGAYGEGGGQILRTSLALACVLGQAVEIINIRRFRKKPGLQPQHLTAVKAAASISRAHVEGAMVGSTKLLFLPSAIRGGEYLFDVSATKGSAGSTSLVLQTILLPLVYAPSIATVSVIGGTHVSWSPPFHFLACAFIPLLAQLAIDVELDINTWGWYPIGGGKVFARVHPQMTIKPIDLTDRGRLLQVRGISAASNLPSHIAMRQQWKVREVLAKRGITAEIEVVDAPSQGKGSLVFLCAQFEKIAVGFAALGAIGKPAENVADEACNALIEHLESRGALDPYLADQIIPYLALSAGPSKFTTSRITQHLLTNIWVVKQFMHITISIIGNEGEPGCIMVNQGSTISGL